MQPEAFNPFEAIYQRLAYLESKLNERTEPTPTISTPDVLDIDALIQYIGNVSKATVYRWLHFRIIPSYRIGRRVFFKRAEIDDWMKTYRRNTIDEMVSKSKIR
ncbi:MAG: helix-turn-helix domain-containing protein [Bacteroidales bacterium]|nr:helix-turn-helix domain-containing protein [Bacteroidales bacterium]